MINAALEALDNPFTIRQTAARPLHCRHPLKTLAQLNCTVPSSHSHHLALESRPTLTGNQPVWLWALALSLLLHVGLLLTELRAWQPPEHSASQTQHLSVSLSASNAPMETEGPATEPSPDNIHDQAEPETDTAPPVEPTPAEPTQALEEAVVLTQEASALELPATEAERPPEPIVETESTPSPEPTATEESRPAEQLPAPAQPAPANDSGEIEATPAPAEAPSLASLAPAEPGFSEADRADLMDDYLQEIMRRLQSAFEYPSAALRRRQQGEVMLELMIEGSGEITSVQLNTGSGHALLDDAALAMVRRLTPLPPLPEHFPDGHLQLGVPVVFRMQ